MFNKYIKQIRYLEMQPDGTLLINIYNRGKYIIKGKVTYYKLRKIFGNQPKLI